MEAVTASIIEVGLEGTSAAEISRRAGVTWGAVQHHFGDKNGILVAVLEESFNSLTRRLNTVDAGLALMERISDFVDRAWDHFGSSSYRCASEILSHYMRSAPELSYQTDFNRTLMRIWLRLFQDAGLTPDRTVVVMHYTVSVLSGLSLMRHVAMPPRRDVSLELDLLKNTLHQEFATKQ